MCASFKVSRSGFYAGQQRAPSTRSIDDSLLVSHIRQAQLMRLARLQGHGHGHGLFRPRPRQLQFQPKLFTRVPNRIRDLDVRAPNCLWHGDVTDTNPANTPALGGLLSLRRLTSDVS